MFRVFLLAAALLCSVHADGQQRSGILTSMAGTWDVQQRMWPGPMSDPIALPPAVAQREVVRETYLHEVMHSDDGASKSDAFTRSATLNFNPVTKQYEYTSLDSRAPQLMVERSQASTSQREADELKLQGGTFLAPEWGASKNVTFAYRLTIGAVAEGRQTVRLYLTPKNVLRKKEFLAFEYVYTKRP